MKAPSTLLTLALAALTVSAARAQNIPFNVIEQSQNSGIQRQRAFHIMDNAEYVRYIGLLERQSTPGSRRSRVDDPPERRRPNWNRNHLVAIHVGPLRTGGHQIEVTRLRRLPNGRVEATVAVTPPARGAIVTQALETPYVLLRTAPFQGTVVIRTVQRRAPRLAPRRSMGGG